MKKAILLVLTTLAFSLAASPVSIISPIDQYVYAGERIDYSGLDSYDPDGGSITQYTWYIDDQQVGTGSGFSQTYMLDKTETHCVITIKLKVKDNEGAIDYYSYQIAIKRKPEYHFSVKDHLGNIRVTVDEQGEIVSKDDYYPFGLRMPGRSHTSGAGNDIYKFSGKELDDENGLGLYYFGARYYDAAVCRFGSVDPHAGSYPRLSTYSYVANNPLKFIDPNGKDVIKPKNNKVLWAVRKAYRTSAKYRALHNKVLKNKNQRWLFRTKSKMNARANTISNYSKFSEKKVTTITTISLDNSSKLYPAGSQAVGTLTNEATHAIEQGNLNSAEDQANFYNVNNPDNSHLIKSSSGVCTEEAKANESQATSEYYEETEEDNNYQDLSNEELDELIFTPTEEKKNE